jgi:hypothetical protein
VSEVHATAYISDTHAEPTHYVVCPVCQGRVLFNLEELQKRGGGSVYCAGHEHRTRSGGDPLNHWHPGNALKLEIFPLEAAKD